MAKSKSKSARRRELRRIASATPTRWWHKPLSRHVLWGMLWVYVLTMIGSLIAFSAQSRDQHEEGQVVEESIVARVSFDTVDQKKTLENKNFARAEQPSVYYPRNAYIQRIKATLTSLGQTAKDFESLDVISRDVQRNLALSTTDRFNELRQYVTNPTNPAWSEQVDRFMRQFTSIPILSADDATRELAPTQISKRIVVHYPQQQGREEVEHIDSHLIDLEHDADRLEERVQGIVKEMFPPRVAQIVADIVLSNPEPLYELDAEETERRRKRAAEAAPTVPVHRDRGEVLVKAGDKLSSLDVALLEQEQAKYEEALGVGKRWLIRLGTMGLILLLAIGLTMYTGAYQHRIMEVPTRGAALVGLVLLAQLLAVVILSFESRSVFAAAFPVILVTMILSIAYDQRYALAVGVITTGIVLISLGMTVASGLVLLAGVTVAAYQLADVRTRSTLVLTGGWTGLAMMAAAFIYGLTTLRHNMPMQFYHIGMDSIVALVAGVMAGLVGQGVLPAIEKAFNVTTSMTLKDLNDASHPLLRRLAHDAPGTYQHSLRIADMAEAAAEAIGSNPLLCRVGSMYHDIGKMNKPMYFIENQQGGFNKHDKLTPAMSLLIIVGHVKDGVEMAREYKLPKAIRHFIESHHGTTLVEYFYHAARKKSETEEAPSPTEFEFRYPGPKPQTKEAAILMLCDCVEGAARALPEPTPVRLEQLVSKLLNKRLMDGQFDECNITLAELHKVEQAVTKTITAIHHGRIAYPEQQRKPEPAAVVAS